MGNKVMFQFFLWGTYMMNGINENLSTTESTELYGFSFGHLPETQFRGHRFGVLDDGIDSHHGRATWMAYNVWHIPGISVEPLGGWGGWSWLV